METSSMYSRLESVPPGLVLTPYSYSRTAIAHCIREQVHMYQKSLFLLGHPSEGLSFQDEDLRTSFLPSLNVTAARSLDQVPSFTPVLNYLSDGELERNEKEREKDLARRRRKGNRGRRGITLPDREVLKTCRTPAVGFPETDASTLNNTAITAPTHKRAAATAATLTITNMIASENGGAMLPPSTPLNIPTTTTVPVQQKDKKPKALFKAPPVPSSVLRPRAHVQAPTPSTGIAGLNVPASAIEGMSTSAPDTRTGVRVLTTKRARELEREARDKEFIDGQHPNFIDGVWHCSNCGCPENIAIGRRKGPLGDKSQCGTCGKFSGTSLSGPVIAHTPAQENTGIVTEGRGLSSTALILTSTFDNRQREETTKGTRRVLVPRRRKHRSSWMNPSTRKPTWLRTHGKKRTRLPLLPLLTLPNLRLRLPLSYLILLTTDLCPPSRLLRVCQSLHLWNKSR